MKDMIVITIVITSFVMILCSIPACLLGAPEYLCEFALAQGFLLATVTGLCFGKGKPVKCNSQFSIYE